MTYVNPRLRKTELEDLVGLEADGHPVVRGVYGDAFDAKVHAVQEQLADLQTVYQFSVHVSDAYRAVLAARQDQGRSFIGVLYHGYSF